MFYNNNRNVITGPHYKYKVTKHNFKRFYNSAAKLNMFFGNDIYCTMPSAKFSESKLSRVISAQRDQPIRDRYN